MSARAPLSFVLPEEAIVLRDATQRACAQVHAVAGPDSDRLAEAVLWLAKCGRGRRLDGTLDAAVLAEDVISEYWDRRLSIGCSASPADHFAHA